MHSHCPDPKCQYRTNLPAQMERHIAATKHGQNKAKVFKGHLSGQHKGKKR
jgi:hypothetical protein